MASVLGTSLSGLLAFQRALDTTSHNIANVNTEGYNRQTVEFAARTPESIGSGFIGQGVNVANVARSYDQFLTAQVRSSTTAFNDADAYQTLTSQIDNLLADQTTGLSSLVKSFFNAANQVANDPTSTAARQTFLASAESVASQFNNVANQLSGLRSQVNFNLQTVVDDINANAVAIADINKQIVQGLGQTVNGQAPNDLLDRRDALLAKLSENLDIKVVQQQNGAVSVLTAQGQALVLGGNDQPQLFSLGDSATDPSKKELVLGGKTITSQVSGGNLGGNLRFRDQVLDPTQKQLGALAASFALQVNKQHGSGYDLSNNPGGSLFGLGANPIQIVSDPTLSGGGSVSAVFDNTAIQNIKPSDYKLDYDGSNYSLTRLSDNQAIALTGFPGSSVSVEGFVLQQTTAPTGPASFLIRPVYNAAQNIGTLITDPAKVAASGPTVSGPEPGNNKNALALAALESTSILNGGTATFAGAYGSLTASVGAAASAATVSRTAQESLLNQARQSQASLSGVNLDEEAANLVKFQNAYQAAAQAVSVSRSLFDTLIGAFR